MVCDEEQSQPAHDPPVTPISLMSQNQDDPLQETGLEVGWAIDFYDVELSNFV